MRVYAGLVILAVALAGCAEDKPQARQKIRKPQEEPVVNSTPTPGPTQEPGTGGGGGGYDGGYGKKEGQKGSKEGQFGKMPPGHGGGHRPGHGDQDPCFDSLVQRFVSTRVEASRPTGLSESVFHTRVSLVGGAAISKASLVIDGELSSGSSEATVCLLSRNVCATVRKSAEMRLDLADLFAEENLVGLLQDEQGISWSISSNVENPNGVVEVEVVNSDCPVPQTE